MAMGFFGDSGQWLANQASIAARQQQAMAEHQLASAMNANNFSWDATTYAGISATAGITTGDFGQGVLNNHYAPTVEKPEPSPQTFIERLRTEIDSWIKLERN